LITKKYGANRTPHTFIIQKTAAGNVIQYIGAIDNNTEGNATEKYVEVALNDLLTGKKPQVTFTKAVGCTIKWKKTAS
jgi:recombinational DNA repair protein RecR